MRRLLLLALGLVALASPAVASAATVDVVTCFDRYCGRDAVRVQAASGEANRLRFTGTTAGIEVSETGGAPLTAGEGCEATAPGTVRCISSAVLGYVQVFAGDADDTVEAATDREVVVTVDAGPGDDRVAGGDASDRIAGGGGRDDLSGGSGEDFIDDGDGPGAPDADVIDGGPGTDLVSYADRRRPVTVRLSRGGSAAPAGQAGEGDRLRGIEGAFGGSGDDLLRASDAGAQTVGDDTTTGLVGGVGDDVLRGGRGPDVISAEAGSDRVDAGAGPDEVALSYGRARRGARVDCGSGRDAVTLAGRLDVLSACEVIEPEELFGTFLRVPLARGAVRLTSNETEDLRVAVRIDAGPRAGALIARRTFGDRTGRLRVTSLARRLARRGAHPRLRVTVLAGRRRSGFRLR